MPSLRLSDPSAGLAPASGPIPADRSAVSAWMEWKLDVPTGNAPVASVLQTEWFTCSIGHESGQVRGTRTHPAGFTGLNAAGYIITWVKWILRPESHRHRLLYERSAFLALPRRNKTGAPARTCTSNLRLRTATCRALTPRELKLGHAGAAPARAVWKTAMRAATSMT